MARKTFETAKEQQKEEERQERLLGEELPWESDDPKEREAWEAFVEASRQRGRSSRATLLAYNAKELTDRGHENVLAEDVFALTKERSLVNLVGREWRVNEKWIAAGSDLAGHFRIPKLVHLGDPPELIVRGLGAYGGKRRARVAPVELTIFDLSNRIVEQLGITDDDKMFLPDPSARVLVVLKDPKRTGVTVTLNRDNVLHRGDWPPPNDWLIRKQWKPPKEPLE